MLIVNEHAEEVKLVTISMRGFYPGCRVEAVYSSDEAIEWASKESWQVILLEEALSPQSGITILPELRRRAPQAAIIVQTERTDAETALQVMRGGADYYLFKRSRAFLTELMIVTREGLEKRDLREKLDRTHERYLRLVETLHDIVYELDAEGRFIYLSPAVTVLLGYTPEELKGSHYSRLLQPDQVALAEGRFNDRRSGARSARHVELRFVPKTGTGGSDQVLDGEVNAKGLYDTQRNFVGTLGVVRDISLLKQQMNQTHHLQEQLEESDRLRELARRLSKASHDLHHPLERLLTDSRHLLNTFRDIQLEPRLERLAADASEAAQIGQDLAHGVPSLSPSQPPVADLEHPADTVSRLQSAIPAHIQPSAGQGAPDRRRSTRTEVQIESYLIVGDTRWPGVTVNMSVGGAYVKFADRLPVLEDQAVHVALKTAISVLDLEGIIRARGLTQTSGSAPKMSGTDLAIEFLAMRDNEQAVLVSLLEGVREGSVAVTLEALVPLLNTPLHETNMDLFHILEDSPLDQRQELRIKVALPARIETDAAFPTTGRHLGLTVNLSRGGACLQVNMRSDILGSRMHLRFTPYSLLSSEHKDPQLVPPNCRLTGRVVWTAEDRYAPSELRVGASGTALRIGLRFERSDIRAEEEINRVLTKHLGSALHIEELQERTALVTIRHELPTAHGLKLVVSEDHAREGVTPISPVITLTPGFGQTMRDLLALSYYLAANGFRVLRYDHTNHVGESDGGVAATTLGGMFQDLTAVRDLARQNWPNAPVALLASDLVAPVALKTVREDHDFHLLILCNPIIDVAALLETQHHRDLVSDYQSGLRRGVVNVLGFNIHLDRFLEDLITGGYAQVSAVLLGVQQLHTPVACIAQLPIPSGRLPAPPPQSLNALRAALGSRGEFVSVGAASMTQSSAGPDPIDSFFREVLARCRATFSSLSSDMDIHRPSMREMHLQARLERERMWTQQATVHAQRRTLWANHLGHAVQLGNLPEHWHLLSQIDRLIGPLHEPVSVLDIACENGDLARLMLLNQAYRTQYTSWRQNRPRYCGMAYIRESLSDARAAFLAFQQQLGTQFSGVLSAYAP
ncbi:MAG: PilZ domain-containing protein, partial [Nitrospiraceae bacterium]